MFTVKTSREVGGEAPQVSIEYATDTQNDMTVSTNPVDGPNEATVESHVTSQSHNVGFSSVEGSYVSLLADIATIEGNNEFENRQLDNISVSDSMGYGSIGNIAYTHADQLTQNINVIGIPESSTIIDPSDLAAYHNIAYVTDTGDVQIHSADGPNIQNIVIIQRPSETGLNEHKSEHTHVIQHAAETDAIQHLSENDVIPHSYESDLIQHSSESSEFQHSSENDAVQHVNETGIIQHPSETGFIHHTSEINAVHDHSEVEVIQTGMIRHPTETCLLEHESGVNIVVMNKELQDAVANISGSISNVSSHNSRLLLANSEGMNLMQNITNQNHIVLNQEGHIASENIQFPSFTSAYTTSPMKSHKTLADTVTTSSSRLQKFTANELKDMGSTEKDILKNYLEQTKIKNRRRKTDTKDKIDSLTTDTIESETGHDGDKLDLNNKTDEITEDEDKNTLVKSEKDTTVLSDDNANNSESIETSKSIEILPEAETKEVNKSQNDSNANLDNKPQILPRAKRKLKQQTEDVGDEKKCEKKRRKKSEQLQNADKASKSKLIDVKKPKQESVKGDKVSTAKKHKLKTSMKNGNSNIHVQHKGNSRSAKTKATRISKTPLKGKNTQKNEIFEKEEVAIETLEDDTEVDEVGLDPEGRISQEELYRQIHYKDRCVIKLAPVILKTLKKDLFIEIEIEDNLLVSPLKKESTVEGKSKYWFTVTKPKSTKNLKKEEPLKRNSGFDQKVSAKSDLPSTKKKKRTSNQKPQSNAETKNESFVNNCDLINAQVNFKVDNQIQATQLDESDNETIENNDNVDELMTTLDDSENKDETIKESADDNNTSVDVFQFDKEIKVEVTDKAFDTESDTYNSNASLIGGFTDAVESDADQDLLMQQPVKGIKSGKKEGQPVQKKKETQSKATCTRNYTVRVTFEGKSLYSCPICGHETTNRQNMTVHTYQHTNERPFQCEVCGQTFKGPSNLNAHKRQHSQEMQYSCPMCNSKFRDRGTYKQHMQRHMGDKKHVCEHCGKSFVISSDLKKHIRVHTGEKPYECNICGKLFSDGSGMVRHRNMHTPKFKFECTACEKQFTRRDLCAYHIKKSHVESELGPVSIKKVSITEEDIISKNIKNVKKKSKPVADGDCQGASNICSKNDKNRKAMPVPPKKEWQNFERLTEEASRRLQEQPVHGYHDSWSHQFGDYRRVPGTVAPDYHHVPTHAMQTIYSNVASQQFYQDIPTNRHNLPTGYPPQNPEVTRNQIWTQEKLMIVENE